MASWDAGEPREGQGDVAADADPSPFPEDEEMETVEAASDGPKQLPLHLGGSYDTVEMLAEMLAHELIETTQRRFYNSGNSGAELHHACLLEVDGEERRVSIHMKAIIMRKRRRA